MVEKNTAHGEQAALLVDFRQTMGRQLRNSIRGGWPERRLLVAEPVIIAHHFRAGGLVNPRIPLRPFHDLQQAG